MLTKAYFVGNSDLKVHSLREGGGVRTLGGAELGPLGGLLGGGASPAPLLIRNPVLPVKFLNLTVVGGISAMTC